MCLNQSKLSGLVACSLCFPFHLELDTGAIKTYMSLFEGVTSLKYFLFSDLKNYHAEGYAWPYSHIRIFEGVKKK